jgi:hypothetical protein
MKDADGTFYWMTLSGRTGFQFATEQQVRAAILRQLRLWDCVTAFNTTAKRKRIADAVMADTAWLRSRYGQLVSATARDAVDDALVGRWTDPKLEVDQAAIVAL